MGLIVADTGSSTQQDARLRQERVFPYAVRAMGKQTAAAQAPPRTPHADPDSGCEIVEFTGMEQSGAKMCYKL